MKFLPDNYQAPKNSNNYMKLQDGENKIRILSSPIVGWEDWIESKPVRYRMDQKPCKSHDPKKPVRHFWTFIVWNYQEERIQILQITQVTIRGNIEALCKDEDWGDPFTYDMKIIRKGEGVDTEYMVNPLPHKEITAKMKEEFLKNRCNLDALFDNGDPFSPEWETFTPGFFEHKQPEKSNKISKEQMEELKLILVKCGGDYMTQVLNHLKNSGANIDTLADLTPALHDKIKAAALKKMEPSNA